MEIILMQLFNTVMIRPYVFIFLLAYIFGCSLHLGFKRAVLFCVFGYAIAWLSELSSIHNGFPYGYYYYIERTRGLETWIFGVPLMDSLSYVFLAYAGYSMALLVISPMLRSGWLIYLLETDRIRHSLYARLLGTIFFVYLDIIIDPVALKGDRWFLGQIYGYPVKGVYFGVPISNFIGWFAVGFLMIYALQKIDFHLKKRGIADHFGYRYPWRYLIGPALYLGVLVFNLSVTFSIEELMLGWVGLFMVILPSVLLFSMIRMKLSYEMPGSIKAHKMDFPQAMIPQ